MQRRLWILLFLSILGDAGCRGQPIEPAPFSAESEDASAGEIQTPKVSSGDNPIDPTDPPEDSSPLDAVDPGDEMDSDADAGANAEGGDAGPDGACNAPLGPGDLTIDELMIDSVAGTGDYGEWIEVRSTLDCVADLRGLHGECPRGAKVATFDVTADVWVQPHGSFVLADSSDPAINHALPGLVLVWFGQPGDVLRNKGSTITLRLRGTLLDAVTYPAVPLAPGISWAFPSDCDPSLRADFTNWKRSTASWFPGFLGTPNQANDDVACDQRDSEP